jgi:general secretion pathway protein G
MSLAPPGANAQRAAFTLLELLAVISISALLASIVLGVGRRASEAGKVARAKAELAALSVALESYQRTYGDYPQTDDEARLLQSLIGRRGPGNAPITGRALIETARLTTAESLDPFTNATATLLDPWEQPYVYAYRTQTPWSNSGYVLYSVGPDGKDYATLLPGGFPDPAPQANADNIPANR